MKKFEIRDMGSWTEDWQDGWSGFDCYEAAESYAEELNADEGKLTEGDEVVIEVREVGKEKINRIVISAEIRVKYNSRDAKDGE